MTANKLKIFDAVCCPIIESTLNPTRDVMECSRCRHFRTMEGSTMEGSTMEGKALYCGYYEDEAKGYK
jgi:hypothetical protein